MEARIVEQTSLFWRIGGCHRADLRDEHVGEREVVAAGATQAQHMPRIEDRGAFGRHPKNPHHRDTGCRARWLVTIPDDARAHQPACMVDSARKIPTAVDAMAAIDSPRTSPRPNPPRKPPC